MQTEEITIQTTADGSPTLYSFRFNETYHSVRGALAESRYLFVENGLAQLSPSSSIRILEIGFGLGVNFLVTAEWLQEHKDVFLDYSTLELYPVSESIYTQTTFGVSDIAYQLWLAAHRAEWNRLCKLSEHLTIHKRREDFLRSTLPQDEFHLVYFDAFSPARVPEQWESAFFKRIYDAMVNGGLLVTYSAQGKVKQALRSVGFLVSRRKGALGKHHMLLATKP